MKPLTLYPHEIRRLQDAGSVLVWRPIDRIGRHGNVTQFGPSNTPGYDWHFRCKHGLWQDYRDADLMKLAPHPPGRERWVRETWAPYEDEPGLSYPYRTVCYAIDEAALWMNLPEAEEQRAHGMEAMFNPLKESDWQPKWRSPATMPRWASRYTVQVAGVDARQVQTATEEEAVEAGLADLTAFSEWWQTRFDTLGPDPWAWATKMEVKQ